MSEQQFHMSDHVRIAEDKGYEDARGCEAIVIGSYNDQFSWASCRDRATYTLHVKDHGQISWFDEEILTLIEHDRTDLLREWEAALKAERTQQGDLDWIFANGQALLDSGKFPSASADALAACLGVTNMWGSHGEFFTYHTNALALIGLATPFLTANDKAGWLEFCKSRKAEHAAAAGTE